MRGYKDTHILVSADCPVEHGVVPTAGKAGKPAHVIQYELLSKPHPCLRTAECRSSTRSMKLRSAVRMGAAIEGELWRNSSFFESRMKHIACF
ncbi:hypothetical protein [Cohnella thermotolerans]|uniref:hypothetical protein n=1 Tax=Cohnella thermotolerans TaxID=329858 RepID=UPI000403D91B|nr:hypothetical protein [Cohnella thermotolerans]